MMDEYARKRLLDSVRPASPTKYPEGVSRPSPAKGDATTTPLHEWAHPALVDIWSDTSKVREERYLWLKVMQVQLSLGVDIPAEAIVAYSEVSSHIDLESIRARERVTRHDVKARLEEFNALASDRAGHTIEYAHLGMTGRDLDDNLEQAMILRSMRLIRRWVEPELQAAFDSWDSRYPMRGFSGPMGTAQDMLDLFGGDRAKLHRLNQSVAQRYGFSRVMDSTGQVYPRSLDFEAGCLLMYAVNGTTLKWDKTPQFKAILRGYVSMLGELAGGQWNEGDVSCSVVRRVALPGMFYAASAVLR